MKTGEQIAGELQRLIDGAYYSEDFELLAAVRGFRDGLAPPEQDELRAVVLQRLLREGSIVDVLLCSVVDVPSAAPALAAKLDRESAPSQLTRALITALQAYVGDEVFRAVERFLDSEQENEALQALARVDFARAAPYIARALRQRHRLDLCLHIFYDRRKRIGLPALAEELRGLAQQQPPEFREQVARALRAKEGLFNPFTEEDVQRLLAVLT